MGVFSALGMAARRWYLLIPLVMAGAGVSYLAYIEMPASYSATVVHEVEAAEPAAGASTTTRRGLTMAARPATAPDPVKRTSDAAAELVGSVNPRPPAGTLPGRSADRPITLTRQPTPSSITVRAVADSSVHARDAVEAVTRQLTDRLRDLDRERGAGSDEQLALVTSSSLSTAPPVRTVGRRVFVVTLAFSLMLSVLLAAAVERTARRRRSLLAGAEESGDTGDRPEGARADRTRADQPPADQPAADRTRTDRDRAERGAAEQGRAERDGAERGRGAGLAGRPEPVPQAEPELLSGAEPALLADARPPLSGSPATPAALSPAGPPPPGPSPAAASPAAASALSAPSAGPGARPDDDSAPTEVVPVLADAGDGPRTAVIPAADAGPPPSADRTDRPGADRPGADRPGADQGRDRRVRDQHGPGGTGRGIPHLPSRGPRGPERGPGRQPIGAHPVADASRTAGPPPPARPLAPRGGRAPMQPRPAPPAEMRAGAFAGPRPLRPAPAAAGYGVENTRVPDSPRPVAEPPTGTDGWLPPGVAPVAVESGPGPAPALGPGTRTGPEPTPR